MNITIDNNSAVLELPQKCTVEYQRELMQFKSTDENYSKLSRLTIDFSKTIYIDSSTIGALVMFSKDFREDERELILANLNDELFELFEDTGLDTIFNFQTESGLIERASIDIFKNGDEVRLDIEQEVTDEILVFHLCGVMNHPVGTRYFKQKFLMAMCQYNDILIDFERLTFFDSLSISVVVGMHKLFSNTGGTLKFCSANYIVQDLFTTLNIDKLIP
jgi:anti-anti-sigma factor